MELYVPLRVNSCRLGQHLTADLTAFMPAFFTNGTGMRQMVMVGTRRLADQPGLKKVLLTMLQPASVFWSIR